MGDLLTSFIEKAKKLKKKLILAEGEEPRMLEAAHRLVSEGIAKVVVLGDEDKIKEIAQEKRIDIKGIEIVNQKDSSYQDEFVKVYCRTRPDINEAVALRLVKKDLMFASLMLATGKCDGMVSEKEFNAHPPLNETRFEKFPLRAHPSDKKIYLGLVKPENADEAEFKRAMLKLGNQFGRITEPYTNEEAEKFTMDTVFALSSNPEIADPRLEEYTDEKGQAFLTFVARDEILEKLTFADKAEKDLNSVLGEAKKELKAYPAFVPASSFIITGVIKNFATENEICFTNFV